MEQIFEGKSLGHGSKTSKKEFGRKIGERRTRDASANPYNSDVETDKQDPNKTTDPEVEE